MAEGVGAMLGTEGTRDLLFELDHADVTLSQIVVEGDAEVVHEGEGFRLVLVKSVQQIFGWRLLGSPALRGWSCRLRVVCEALRQEVVIAALEAADVFWR